MNQNPPLTLTLGFIGAILQAIVALSILKCGFFPPDLTPPEDWPTTQRSRELYKPWVIFSPTKTIFD